LKWGKDPVVIAPVVHPREELFWQGHTNCRRVASKDAETWHNGRKGARG
jgi:hypothetical protein